MQTEGQNTTAATERYAAAAHAVQSGVAAEIGLDGVNAGASSPKHLRTGVNVAMTDLGSLARLLIAKGVISLDEYAEAVAVGMEAEKERYEQHLSERLGKPITLA